jgi:uncharacterized membrane protein
MKRPGILLAISVGLMVVGSAVCLPGVCGCVSWLGIPNADRFGVPFAILSGVGFLGGLVSVCWLAGSAITRVLGWDR